MQREFLNQLIRDYLPKGNEEMRISANPSMIRSASEDASSDHSCVDHAGDHATDAIEDAMTDCL